MYNALIIFRLPSELPIKRRVSALSLLHSCDGQNQCLSPANSFSYRSFGGLFGPASWPLANKDTIYLGFMYRIVNDRPWLDFSLAFFTHNNMTKWQELSYITLPTLFSIFRRIIEPARLFSYWDIIPFVRWQNFIANLNPFWLAFAMPWPWPQVNVTMWRLAFMSSVLR